jgi:hypothetical protein
VRIVHDWGEQFSHLIEALGLGDCSRRPPAACGVRPLPLPSERARPCGHAG